MHGGQEGKQRLGTEEEKPQTSEVPVYVVQNHQQDHKTQNRFTGRKLSFILISIFNVKTECFMTCLFIDTQANKIGNHNKTKITKLKSTFLSKICGPISIGGPTPVSPFINRVAMVCSFFLLVGVGGLIITVNGSIYQLKAIAISMFQFSISTYNDCLAAQPEKFLF